MESVCFFSEPVQGVGNLAQGAVLDGVQQWIPGQLTVKKRLVLHGLADFQLPQRIVVVVMQVEDQPGFFQSCFFQNFPGI